MRRGVLVTRPEPGLTETIRALSDRGWSPISSPLLYVLPLSPTIPGAVRTVLLTSGQAAGPLSTLAPWLLDRPILAVGDATAARARSVGFSTVQSVAGDADRLAACVIRECDPAAGTLLLACGRGQGVSLAGRLRAAGFIVSRRCVYRAAPVRRLDNETIASIASGELAAALFFSTETAAAFVRILPARLHPALAGITALAISTRAAEPLRSLAWAGIEAAREPTAASMLGLLEPAP